MVRVCLCIYHAVRFILCVLGCCRFCKPCLQADPKRSITLKPPARKSARKRTQRDYAGLNAGNEQDPNRSVCGGCCDRPRASYWVIGGCA